MTPAAAVIASLDERFADCFDTIVSCRSKPSPGESADGTRSQGAFRDGGHWKKGENCYDVKLTGKGVRVIQGTTDYGVSTKSKDNPYLLRYHPRAVVGAPKEMKPDAALVVEIIPILDAGNLRLLVAAKGKAVADAEVNVMLPGGKKQKTKTDTKGLTESFDAPGRYGAWVRHTEATAGEHDGKKYNEVRNYATLVIDLEGKSK